MKEIMKIYELTTGEYLVRLETLRIRDTKSNKEFDIEPQFILEHEKDHTNCKFYTNEQDEFPETWTEEGYVSPIELLNRGIEEWICQENQRAVRLTFLLVAL